MFPFSFCDILIALKVFDMSKPNDNYRTEDAQMPVCGIVMPIASLGDYPESHWNDVLEILEDVAGNARFIGKLVSRSEISGVIQKRIIQNLYNNDIVICDVSGKNANVMLELGMRLAFDKPTIIIKDDVTDFSFDTAPYEHIIYPKDLRFNEIVKFKLNLKTVIEKTYNASKDSNYATFLQSFGHFITAKIEQTEVSKDDFIIEKVSELENTLQRVLINARRNDLFKREALLPTAGPSKSRLEERVSKLTITWFGLIKNLVLKALSENPDKTIDDFANGSSMRNNLLDFLIKEFASHEKTRDYYDSQLERAIQSMN